MNDENPEVTDEILTGDRHYFFHVRLCNGIGSGNSKCSVIS